MLINWAPCKARVLERGSQRAHKFTRVSKEWVPYLESIVMRAIDNGVHSHPSMGSTLYPPIRPTNNQIIEKED
jgi:hypothetical protein